MLISLCFDFVWFNQCLHVSFQFSCKHICLIDHHLQIEMNKENENKGQKLTTPRLVIAIVNFRKCKQMMFIVCFTEHWS